MGFEAKIVELAKQEIGYLEKASAFDLDSMYANAGNANFTKYARDIDAIGDWYNGRKQGYAWCTQFTDWLFIKCFGVETARQMLYRPKKSLGAGCKFCVEYYKAKGKYTKEPAVGRVIYFADSDGIPCHTGVVVAVDATTVTTIEGNTSNASGVISNGGGVAMKTYNRSYGRIHGYGVPDYSIVKEEEEEMTEERFRELLVKVLTTEEFQKMMNAALLSRKDNDAGNWSEADRKYVIDNGYINGVGKNEDGTQNYAWETWVTREMLAAVIHRMAENFAK